jgi:hypothetical protein
VSTVRIRWHRLERRAREVGDAGGGTLVPSGEGELAGAVGSDEEVELASLCADLGNVDVEVANGIGREAPSSGLVALGVRQAADAMALQAAVQG